MQANRNERLSQESARQGRSTQTIITAISVLILAVFAWIMLRDDSEPPAEPDTGQTTPTENVVPATPPPPPAPDIPVTVETSEWADAGSETDADAQTAEEPLPEEPAEPPLTLANSDERLRDQLSSVVPSGLPATVLGNTDLVERSSAAIDALRRGLVPDRLLNLRRPEGPFKVESQGDKTVIDPASYRRYDGMVSSLADTPVAPVVTTFQRFRPLLEEAYGALGYPEDEMDNALIAALDEILATPVIDETIAVRRSEAVWAYEREDLESLSLLQKQLLRTGPDNVRRLKEKAREMRNALLNP